MLVPLSFMHLDSPAWPTNGHRSDAFALEPVIQVGFQDQHGLPRFISSQVTPLDRAVDGVVTAFDQLSRLTIPAISQKINSIILAEGLFVLVAEQLPRRKQPFGF